MSLRGLPKRESAVRSGMPLIKRILFSAAGSKYDVAGPKQKAAYDSAFVSTIRTVRPAVAEHLIRAKANADRAKRAAAADKK